MSKRNPLKFINNMSKFYIVVFQEFSSCRNIIKKIFDLKIGTFGRLHRFLKLQSATFDIDVGSNDNFAFPRLQLSLRYGCNGSESFSTNPFGGNFENSF